MCWFRIQIRFLKFQLQHQFLGKFGPKSSKFFVLFEICAHNISRMLIPNPDLYFWNFDTKIHFWANLGPKSQSCLFCLKIGTHGISRKLILIATLVFWISNPNFLFGQICMPTVCQDSFYEFPNLCFFSKFGPKKSNLSILPENWHTCYLEDADSYFKISFLNFKT